MNMFKKNGGFTLVELIVVIAILAILAGIAVPAYSGYLKSAEKAGDITTLSAVKTACFACMATEGEVDKIEVTAADGVVSAVKVTLTQAPAEEGESTEAAKVVDLYTYDATNGATYAEGYDFKLYMATVGNLGYFTDGAVWTAAEGEWENLIHTT